MPQLELDNARLRSELATLMAVACARELAAAAPTGTLAWPGGGGDGGVGGLGATAGGAGAALGVGRAASLAAAPGPLMSDLAGMQHAASMRLPAAQRHSTPTQLASLAASPPAGCLTAASQLRLGSSPRESSTVQAMLGSSTPFSPVTGTPPAIAAQSSDLSPSPEAVHDMSPPTGVRQRHALSGDLSRSGSATGHAGSRGLLTTGPSALLGRVRDPGAELQASLQRALDMKAEYCTKLEQEICALSARSSSYEERISQLEAGMRIYRQQMVDAQQQLAAQQHQRLQSQLPQPPQ
ncbi:hypothetical protein QJQ45_016726, partial [Haematococcus lacustris]